MRSKFLGKTNGALGSDMGAPVPFDLGRPAPSCTVNLALKSFAPNSINWTVGMVNSSPSCRCVGMATSRPTCELGLCPEAAIAITENRPANQMHARRTVLLMTSSFVRPRHLQDGDSQHHGERVSLLARRESYLPRPLRAKGWNASE